MVTALFIPFEKKFCYLLVTCTVLPACYLYVTYGALFPASQH